MKSYQLSVIGCQLKRGLMRIRLLLLKTENRKPKTILFLLLFLCSCGDEGLIDPYPEISLPKPQGKLYATDIPTDTGSAWTYINVDTDQEFTLRVEGTRDVSGTTHRQMTVSEMSSVEDDQFNWQAVDHLVANAFYLRFDTEFVDVFPFPIFATYFSKTPQALVESAFDIFVPDSPNSVTVQHKSIFHRAVYGIFHWKSERNGSFLKRLPGYQ